MAHIPTSIPPWINNPPGLAARRLLFFPAAPLVTALINKQYWMLRHSDGGDRKRSDIWQKLPQPTGKSLPDPATTIIIQLRAAHQSQCLIFSALDIVLSLAVSSPESSTTTTTATSCWWWYYRVCIHLFICHTYHHYTLVYYSNFNRNLFTNFDFDKSPLGHRRECVVSQCMWTTTLKWIHYSRTKRPKAHVNNNKSKVITCLQLL